MSSWDDVVVGGGLVGAAVARRLAEAGRRVLMVEKGQPVTEPPASHLRNRPSMQRSPDSFFADIDQYFDYLNPDAAPAGLPGAFTTAVDGGMGIVWTNNCPRAVEGVDRPTCFGRTEWNDLYALAERYLYVRSDQFTDSHRRRFVERRLEGVLGDQDRNLVQLPLSGGRIAPEHIRFIAPADVLGTAGFDIDRIAGVVDRVVLDGSRSTGVVVDGDSLGAENVIICAGAVETPVLLWKSGVSHAALGRFLSFHPVLIAQIVLDSEQLERMDGPDSLPRLSIPPTAERPWQVMLLRDTNPLAVEPSDEGVPSNRLIECQVFQPVEPNSDNHMSISGEGKVSFDLPLRNSDLDLRAAIEVDVHELCGQLGRFRDGCHPQWAPLGTPHLMGSCRMGTVDDGTSVADIDGRLRGSENVYLATNGLIPSRLAVNPTLTTTAIALRTADRIIGT